MWTCKQFRNIINAHISESIAIFETDDSRNVMQIIAKNPKFRHLIRAIHIAYPPIRRRPRDQQAVSDLITLAGLERHPDLVAFRNALEEDSRDVTPAIVIALLRKIEMLEIILPGRDHPSDSNGYVLDLLDLAGNPGTRYIGHGFQWLTHLRIIFNFNSGEMPVLNGSFLEINSPRKVYLRNVEFVEDETDWECEAYSSPVTNLHLNDLDESDIPAFDLRSFTGLRKFRLELRPINVVEDLLALQDLGTVLATQNHSIECVELWTNESYTFNHHRFQNIKDDYNSKPFDYRVPISSLHDFNPLKSLSMTDILLVGSTPNGLRFWNDLPETTVQNLRGMLPSSLELYTHLVWEGDTDFQSLLGGLTRSCYSRNGYGI
jgi:hypothetical protein